MAKPHVNDLVFQLHARKNGDVVPILALQIVMDVLENKEGVISTNG